MSKDSSGANRETPCAWGGDPAKDAAVVEGT
jgi:hypothetical protein